LAEVYRKKVADLQTALADRVTHTEALGLLRALIERVEVRSAEGGFAIELVGEVAHIVTLSAGAESVLEEGTEGRSTALELSRHVNQSLTISERLLTGWPKRNACMGADSFQQHCDGLGDRAAVAPQMKIPQKLKSVDDLDGGRVKSRPVDHLHWVETADLKNAVAVGELPKGEEGLVAESEERSTQRSERDRSGAWVGHGRT
jgi:hypothetical protein